MRCLLLLLLTVSAAAPIARAQATPNCPTRPASLEAMRGCYRPLLVFAPAAGDPRLAEQQAALDAAADDMMDRNVLYLPVLADRHAFSLPLDVPYAVLSEPQLARLRRRFHVESAKFQVVLLGEDGSEKLHSSKPVRVEELNALIDSMPTRKLEMQRPHSN
jgi:hypothetical protein